MSLPFYLPRILSANELRYSEKEILQKSKYILILAEPGAGKSDLLTSLAKQLSTQIITANVFSRVGTQDQNSPLVIDGFDELSRINQSGIDDLLGMIHKANPTHVVISSRSSEWNVSATKSFEDFIGHEPLCVKLIGFDEAEQEQIYTNYTQKSDFAEFRTELSRFSLDALLPNPLFLKLFADSFIESNGHFENKLSIFSLAVVKLAKENNTGNKPDITLTYDKKIALASEVFAKILLAGAEGICISETTENRSYPLLGSLREGNSPDMPAILATGLFKPGDNPDQHRSVHKIVAEYCAASYFIKRINSESDSLILEHCLPVIAPNSIVRIELRGLVAWMAALGNDYTQKTIIKLDPYAVLANGDPSQLSASSKRLLIKQLKKMNANDPHFRRSDLWRTFNIAGFFTPELIGDIKPIILTKSEGNLRNLLIELLVDSAVSEQLIPEWRQLILNQDEDKLTRLLAIKCLANLEQYHLCSDLKILVSEGSDTSLNIATSIIKSIGPERFDYSQIETFILRYADLYSSPSKHLRISMHSRTSFNNLITCMNLEHTQNLLESLSKKVVCTCGKNSFRCDCRTALSKIIGRLLDRYFLVASPPFEPLKVWQWLRNLNFRNSSNISQIFSVQLLRKDHQLRQGIIAHVFGNLTDREQIFETKLHRFNDSRLHAGLQLTLDDLKFIAELAFEKGNLNLWSSLLTSHNMYLEHHKNVTDTLRTQMRKQANQAPNLMRIWASANRREAKQRQSNHINNQKFKRSIRREENRKKKRMLQSKKFVLENHTQIESGQNWSCLEWFSRLTLHYSDQIHLEVGDEYLVKNSLKNCLDFIEADVPNLQTLAEMKCKSKPSMPVEDILFAACIEIMRAKGNLEGIKHSLLFALRTNFNHRYPAVREVEWDSIKSEVDRLLFSGTETAEYFLRQYLEPQVASPECVYPRLELLKNENVFSPLKAKLAIEWLSRFETIESYTLETIFNIVIENGKRGDLNKIILTRCDQLLKGLNTTSDGVSTDTRKFWFKFAFYFLPLEEAEPYWNWLKDDKNSLFLFNQHSARMNRSDNEHWSIFSANKVEALLEAYYDQWPKVYLPSHYGTGSPCGEVAYRFLTEIYWHIRTDKPDDAIAVLNRLLASPKFADFHIDLKGILAEQIRNKALLHFEPPTPQAIVSLLDNNAVVTVEGLRQMVLQELIRYQRDIYGDEYNPADRFYTKDKEGNDKHLDEITAVEIIAERLKLVIQPKDILIDPEHLAKNQNRVDFTASKMISGKRRLLVVEAKGQWHRELFTAASTQLSDRYAIHPDAENQGIYLVIWFGANVEVAGKKNHDFKNVKELKTALESKLSPEIKGLIDIFVLDVSKT